MVRDVRRALPFDAQPGFAEVFRDDDHAPRFAMVARDAACLAIQWHDDVGVAEVTDTSWGTREFHLRDPDGNGLQFYADL